MRTAAGQRAAKQCAHEYGSDQAESKPARDFADRAAFGFADQPGKSGEPVKQRNGTVADSPMPDRHDEWWNSGIDVATTLVSRKGVSLIQAHASFLCGETF